MNTHYEEHAYNRRRTSKTQNLGPQHQTQEANCVTAPWCSLLTTKAIQEFPNEVRLVPQLLQPARQVVLVQRVGGEGLEGACEARRAGRQAGRG